MTWQELINILYVFHPEYDMPDLFVHPTDTKTIRALRLGSPFHHPLVIRPWPLQNALTADSKLSATDISNVLRNSLSGDIEEGLIDFREKRADVVVIDIDLRRFPWIYACRTARVMVASEVDVAHRVDGFKAEIPQRGARKRTEEVVMPLINVGVDEN